jgi:hypothetical protein
MYFPNHFFTFIFKLSEEPKILYFGLIQIVFRFKASDVLFHEVEIMNKFEIECLKFSQ